MESGYQVVLKAIGKLTDDNVKKIIESKSDDKERVIKFMLLEYMSKEQASQN